MFQLKLSRARRLTVSLVAALVLAGAAVVIALRHGALPAIDPPAPDRFSVADVRRGAQLAALGGCIECHSTSGLSPLSGGRAVPTPFGVIHSTNITPDPKTGIGHWSMTAFRRAMREGVDREGRHLYPAFPYDHFTLVTDADDAALYAFLMTRRPVHAAQVENDLPFPFSWRGGLAVWNLFFLHEGPYENDPAHDARWNRGAYLATGIAHCGACHASRNTFGAERSRGDLDGATVDGWRSYALDAASPAAVRWNAHALYAYLKEGWHPQHGVAQGPMAAVTAGLQSLPDADVDAIAQYIASLGTAGGVRHSTATTNTPDLAVTENDGAAIFAAACAACHDGSGSLPFTGMTLALSSAITDRSATNLLNIVLDGLHPPEGAAGPIMPGFATAMSDAQLESLAAFVRNRFAAKPPWSDVAARLRDKRLGSHD